jgi:uncharacterized phage-associated protein
VFLNVLKLHKILYYCQAWSLAFGRGPLFPGSNFQAWVHVHLSISDAHLEKAYGFARSGVIEDLGELLQLTIDELD